MGKLAKAMSGQIQPGAKPFKAGGSVHTDEAEDRKMIKSMVKKEALAKKCGGKVKK